MAQINGEDVGEWQVKSKQSFTNLLYGGHEGGETSTVVSWLCVIHKRIAVGCRWRVSCMSGNFDIGFCGGHGRQVMRNEGSREIRKVRCERWCGVRCEV